MAEGGVRHYKEWTPRPIRRGRYEYEDESKETSTILNLLGYGSVIRQKRIDLYKEKDRLLRYLLFKCLNADMVVITAGSKAEGLTCIFESDKDVINVIPYNACLEDGVDDSTIPGHINVFKMDTQGCNSGYCRPLLLRQGRLGNHPAIIHSLCDDGYGNIILSSTCFNEYVRTTIMQLFSNPTAHYSPMAGPSLPWSVGNLRNDAVQAICCNCPVILQKWASRTRYWPPQRIVEKVITLGAFVTPIGCKGSEFNHMEWRVCFNTAETELVNNLNITQVNIYIMLKMIVKDVLKPRKKEITSYILKNIVLWLAENNPQTLFHSGSLLHFLHVGLDMLRTAISFIQLPYYMLPERNLMAERELDVEQQRVFVSSITDMLEEGPKMLLRLNKIRQAIICHPEPLLWFSKMRTELEMVRLEQTNRLGQCLITYLGIHQTNTIKQRFIEFIESDITLQACEQRVNEIMFEVRLRLLLEGSSVTFSNQLEDMILS
ncbi:hypothetical protein DPMN_037791 [Dreissena polymorpha]|uniref:Mab-21-like HhH/H2TH-like domain-containing protein n=1 Tax=Dreissena polymorpha TaxID=45954 RepID=A0A9D4RMM2_DREPO|nr:hypothetical protein DPMN_037791 [Dreissena polymorpha]